MNKKIISFILQIIIVYLKRKQEEKNHKTYFNIYTWQYHRALLIHSFENGLRNVQFQLCNFIFFRQTSKNFTGLCNFLCLLNSCVYCLLCYAQGPHLCPSPLSSSYLLPLLCSDSLFILGLQNLFKKILDSFCSYYGN